MAKGAIQTSHRPRKPCDQHCRHLGSVPRNLTLPIKRLLFFPFLRLHIEDLQLRKLTYFSFLLDYLQS